MSWKKIIGRAFLVAILIAGGIFGYIKYREAQRYETTDDAQVDTDITPVTSKISGFINSVNVTDNQRVHRGDTIMTIDNRDLELKVKQAEAALDNAQALLETARANAVAVAESSKNYDFEIDALKPKYEQAQRDYDRYQILIDKEAATQQQFENAKTAKETLAKQLDGLQQKIKEATTKTKVAQAQVEVAKSTIEEKRNDLDVAKLQLTYSYITAPFDGIISRKSAVVGQFVQTGQPLCSILQEQNIWVTANYKETQIHNIRLGDDVIVEVDAFPDKEFTGTVASFAPATGSQFALIPPDNATGNYVKVVQRIPVKIAIDTTNAAFDQLKAGMSVYVKVIVQK